MGQNDGYSPKKDPRRLSPLPSGYPCWTPYTTESTGMNDWKAVCLETGTYSLVGGRWKRADSVPRQRPTQLGALEIPRTFDRRVSRDDPPRNHAGAVQSARSAQVPWQAA